MQAVGGVALAFGVGVGAASVGGVSSEIRIPTQDLFFFVGRGQTGGGVAPSS